MKAERIRYDYDGMMAEAVGEQHGISKQEIEGCRPRLIEIHQEMAARRGEPGYGFMELPAQNPSPILKLARTMANTHDDLIHIGIGGSALGTKALVQALRPPLWNLMSRADRKGRPRIHFLENVDPDEVTELVSRLNPKKTIVHVVTKSGETTETMANFMIVRGWLTRAVGKEKARRGIIATTDPQKGPLRQLVQAEGYASLPIPPTVGGRFSVLTAVGLFPAAMLGIDIRGLLAGAGDMENVCRDSDPWKNPAMMRSALLYLAAERKKKPITVLMPYAQAMTGLADWYVQLVAESLGKKQNRAGQVVNAGLTPIRAVGATDQHSQLQLFLEGPCDKTITFLRIERFQRRGPIPQSAHKVPGIEELAGHTLEELIHLELEATEHVMMKAHRPNGRLTLSSLTPFALGQLIYFLELEVVYTAGLYGINPFDQPAVQAGKEIVHRALQA
jgi:glucose-6-phosphate isomerase